MFVFANTTFYHRIIEEKKINENKDGDVNETARTISAQKKKNSFL